MTEIYSYKAYVNRIVDGDTLDLQLDLGFQIYTVVRVRLKGVDTPEIYGVKKGSEEYKAGKVASDYVQKWVNAYGPVFVVQTEQDKGKYGRYIAEILTEDLQHNLGQDLLEAGLAEPYA